MKTVLTPDYPFFIYFNSKEYISHIFCAVKPYDREAELKRSYCIKNSVILVHRKDEALKERIIKHSELEKVSAKLSSASEKVNVFIKGKQIKLRTEKPKSE